MKRFRLTVASKILIVLVVIAVLVGAVFGAGKLGFIGSKKTSNKTTSTSVAKADDDGNVINTKKDSSDTINLSLDEWIGWKEIIDANGGLSTQPGSIYDKLGIKVNISVINDATQSSNAMIKGNLDAAGYTINRTAFLSTKFKEAGIPKGTRFVLVSRFVGGDRVLVKR